MSAGYFHIRSGRWQGLLLRQYCQAHTINYLYIHSVYLQCTTRRLLNRKSTILTIYVCSYWCFLRWKQQLALLLLFLLKTLFELQRGIVGNAVSWNGTALQLNDNVMYFLFTIISQKKKGKWSETCLYSTLPHTVLKLCKYLIINAAYLPSYYIYWRQGYTDWCSGKVKRARVAHFVRTISTKFSAFFILRSCMLSKLRFLFPLSFRKKL